MLLETVAPCLARAPEGTIISRWRLGHDTGTLNIFEIIFIFLDYLWSNFPGSTWQSVAGHVESPKSGEKIVNKAKLGRKERGVWSPSRIGQLAGPWSSGQKPQPGEPCGGRSRA